MWQDVVRWIIVGICVAGAFYCLWLAHRLKLETVPLDHEVGVMFGMANAVARILVIPLSRVGLVFFVLGGYAAYAYL